MGRRIKKHKKKIVLLISSNLKEKNQIHEGQFPLNRNGSDRIRWTVELNKQERVIEISNVSYEILYENNWIWIIRFDDHGGKGKFHKHERFSIANTSDITTSLNLDETLTKEEETQWAIDDLRKNYLEYREKFLANLGLAIY